LNQQGTSSMGKRKSAAKPPPKKVSTDVLFDAHISTHLDFLLHIPSCIKPHTKPESSGPDQ
jgi:hypothetical protein